MIFSTKKWLDSEQRQKDYYDQIANQYDLHYSTQLALDYRRRIHNSFLADFSFENREVLDAMCGGGQDSVFFIEKGAHVTGIDISEAQCEHFKERNPQSSVICGTVTRTEFKDNQFDYIYIDSLHHLHPHVSVAMDEFTRILKPGGTLILWEPTAGSIFDLIRKAWYRLDPKYFQDNEASIDPIRLSRDHASKFELSKISYGGNFGYIFVFLSMALRIPVWMLGSYGRFVLTLEELFCKIQSRRTSLWFLMALEKKRPGN